MVFQKNKTAQKKKPQSSKPGAENNPLFVNSLQKGFEILRAFTPSQRYLNLADISRITGLDKSSTQRFVYTLYTLGYLNKKEPSKLYSISPKMLEFSYTYLHGDYLVEASQPFLVQAHEKTKEAVNISILDENDVLIVSRIPSQQVISVDVHVGTRIPALYSSPGRMICALLSTEKQKALLDSTNYEKYTEHSVASRHAMQRAIKEVKNHGYCIAHSQFFYGDISVAAPVFDSAGEIVAAISIATSDTRMTVEEACDQLVPEALNAARRISAAFSRM